jgi:hypothetical protein
MQVLQEVKVSDVGNVKALIVGNVAIQVANTKRQAQQEQRRLESAGNEPLPAAEQSKRMQYH